MAVIRNLLVKSGGSYGFVEAGIIALADNVNISNCGSHMISKYYGSGLASLCTNITANNCYVRVSSYSPYTMKQYGLGENVTANNCYAIIHNYGVMEYEAVPPSSRTSYYHSGISNSIVTGSNERTTAQMKTQSTFVGWNFENIWGLNPLINDGYPSFVLGVVGETNVFIKHLDVWKQAESVFVKDDGTWKKAEKVSAKNNNEWE